MIHESFLEPWKLRWRIDTDTSDGVKYFVFSYQGNLISSVVNFPILSSILFWFFSWYGYNWCSSPIYLLCWRYPWTKFVTGFECNIFGEASRIIYNVETIIKIRERNTPNDRQLLNVRLKNFPKYRTARQIIFNEFSTLRTSRLPYSHRYRFLSRSFIFNIFIIEYVSYYALISFKPLDKIKLHFPFVS